jgi:O-antigen chain-terminating methyltransferase
MGGFDYVEFERRFRGPRAEIKNRLRAHVPRFAGCADVLELGCGRGEFLELMGEAGIAARGVDIDPQMVEACVAHGLNAVVADALGYLASLKDSSVGGIFGAHVVEHLTPMDQRRLVDLCRGKLRPGGPLVLETPNPLSLAALPSQLTLDPTHEKLLHPELLRFIFESAGFASVELMPLQPWPPGATLEAISTAVANDEEPDWLRAINRNFARLNRLLFQAQDYAAVGWKPVKRTTASRMGSTPAVSQRRK